MTVKDLERLYDYGYWANHKLIAVVSRLTPEQFTRTFAGGYGSVRNTMVHMLSAEWGWLDRCGGHQRGPALKADDYPDVESLVDTWGKVETWLRAFLATLKDEDLHREVDFKYDADQRGVSALMFAPKPLLQHPLRRRH